MAQKTIIQLTDDIDGSEATETVVFGLDGSTYEIDLNDAHGEDLREILAPYVVAARKVGASSGGARTSRVAAPRPRTSSEDNDPKAVRAWAEANGIEVSARGRIKGDILEQYKAAQA